ncbi:NADH-quinone oxidoreductase subunit NuoG [Flavisolibacter tropicus]|uniref:NADH-quinone oxidoreductase n=1 Tax=Flavisolibacter tropicus TaxID=1492898 RepID=A0A172TRA2_9BACT|nr:NADH-quinone oxidoreductase subunit NuoG [Flavisolibacter tropicus]ANE49560.1 NADH dehydrogenase [Flavisolibacter tropicus]
MPTIYIDKVPYNVKAGKTLLEACLTLGFNLPYFCWHPAMGSVGACRQCAVKVFKDSSDTQGRLIMSCMEEVKEGQYLSISDPTAEAFREQVIEWLMTNHPHDCPVCDEGGSCHLQDMTVMTGHDYRRYEFKKRTYRNQYLGPLIHHEMNRCIQCYRCVRYYHDYAGGNDLNVFSAHNHVYFGREKDGVLESPFSGNLAEVCPTGVFTDKTLKEHYTRKWDLTMSPSICHHCSVGCNTIAGERYGEVRCVVNRYNGEVNGYFLCDRGRFGYEFVNSENRVQRPLIRHQRNEAVSDAELSIQLRTTLSNTNIIGIGSPRASLESNFALRQLVGSDNFYQGVSEDEAYLNRKVLQLLNFGEVQTASLKEIESADAVLILGEDIWNTAPMMALAVRQAVKKTAALQVSQKGHLPLWNDAAIKEQVQESNGFLANITIAGSPLDEITTETCYAAPDDIARLGFAIAHELNDSLPSVSNLSEELTQKVASIAHALRQAQHPVIISGITCFNEGIVKAAFDIAATLNSPERKAKLAYIMQECNSVGLTMMQAPFLQEAISRLKRQEETTVVILENDLYHSTNAPIADELFKLSGKVIVIDHLHNRTTEKADILIPAATFAEADGTLINYEGRAQRFYQVFMPDNPFIKESWRWLSEMLLIKNGTSNGKHIYLDRFEEQLEAALPQFKGLTKVAPSHNFTIHGERIPRQPHRYSGRTAMRANIQVSEPKPLQDNDSPLSFTMEGLKGYPPSPLIPFFWSPGWNSVQSVLKYQEEPGGSLRGGDPGIRLLNGKKEQKSILFKDIPEAFKARSEKWLLLPQYHVLGSGELSSYTKALASLSPEPFVSISVHDAEQLSIKEGGWIKLLTEGNEYSFPVKINNHLSNGLVLVSAGLKDRGALSWGNWSKIEKVEEK